MLETAKTSPSTPGRISSTRTAYTRKTEKMTLPKKLNVAVLAAIQRR